MKRLVLLLALLSSTSAFAVLKDCPAFEADTKINKILLPRNAAL